MKKLFLIPVAAALSLQCASSFAAVQPLNTFGTSTTNGGAITQNATSATLSVPQSSFPAAAFLSGQVVDALSFDYYFTPPEGFAGFARIQYGATIVNLSQGGGISTVLLPSFTGLVTFALVGASTGGIASLEIGHILLADVMPAVPEPETYAMLLAGLGVMGFVARRRSGSVQRQA